MGLLKVTGTIDVGQFWPNGSSDADTAKVVVQTGGNAFKFQSTPGGKFVVTHVFEGAKVKGSVTTPPIDNKGRLTIRFEHIDAPELHYRPAALSSKAPQVQRDAFKAASGDFRQHYGESAAAAAAKRLGGAGVLPCTVMTRVDSPNDVFDTYGRFIGEVVVHVKGSDVNLNAWLVRQGWAFPSFYVTAKEDEVRAYLAAAKVGRKKKRIWSGLQKKIDTFDSSLLFRSTGQPDAAADAGPLIIPKIFRRQCAWWTRRQAGAVTTNFKSYLVGNPDALVLTEDFLANGVHSATPRHLDEFLQPDGTFTLQPEDMVFMEKPSTLLDANNKKITAW